MKTIKQKIPAALLAALLAAAARADGPVKAADAAPAPDKAPAVKQDEKAAEEKKEPAAVFEDIDFKHYVMFGEYDGSFKNGEEDLAGKIVVQAVVDYEKPEAFDYDAVKSALNYAGESEGLCPVVFFAVIDSGRLNNKKLDKFRKAVAGEERPYLPFPVYFKGAGLKTDKPPVKFPWFYLVGIDGKLEYSGDSVGELTKKFNSVRAKLPEPDPVFAFWKPGKLKPEIEKYVKPGGSYAQLEAFLKKKSKTDDEAAALLRGMKMMYSHRLTAMSRKFHERPGLAMLESEEFLNDFPDAKADPRFGSMQRGWLATVPEAKKLVKLEKELARLKGEKEAMAKTESDGGTVPPAALKKFEAAKAALSKKVEKFTKSKNQSAVSGAELMMVDIGEL